MAKNLPAHFTDVERPPQPDGKGSPPAARRMVEVAFAETSELDEGAAVVLIRVPLYQQFAHVAEARLEALQTAQTLIATEIEATKHKRDRKS